MDKFKNLKIGDMFNTKPARYVKITDTTAIVVMSGIAKVGEIEEIHPDLDVIVLYPN